MPKPSHLRPKPLTKTHRCHRGGTALDSLGVVVALVIMRLVLILRNPDLRPGMIFGDQSVHLVIIRYLGRRWSNAVIPQFLIGEKLPAYPVGFHRFAGLFSDATLMRWPWLPNFILWILSLFGLFAIYPILVFTPSFGTPVWLVLAITFTAPGVIRSTDRFASHWFLSERLLGMTLTGVVFLLVSVSETFLSPTTLIAVVAVSIAICSSIFARQVLVGGLPVVSAIQLSPYPLLVLTAGASLALLVAPRRTIYSFVEMVRRWGVYKSRIANSEFLRHSLSQWVRFSGPHGTWSKDNLRHILTQEPVRSWLQTPEHVFAVAIALFFPSAMARQYLPVLIAAFLLSFITATKRFNFLGESGRYLEFALWAVSGLVISQGITANGYLIVVWISLWIVSMAFEAITRRQASRAHVPELDDVLAHGSLQDSSVVFCIDMRVGPDIAARSNVRVFWWQPATASTSLYDEYISAYPYLRVDWEHLREKHSVTHILVDKRRLGPQSPSYLLPENLRVCSTLNYELFEL